MTAGGGCTGDNGEGDADGETPANLKDAAKSGDANGGGDVEGEAGYGCYSRETGEESIRNIAK